MPKFMFATKAWEYFKPFVQQRWACYPYDKDKVGDADCIVFVGGPDINPYMYWDDEHTKTLPSSAARDEQEVEAFLLAKKHGIPCLGICRGAQFLTVMSGGSLFQHVNGHLATHMIHTKNESFTVNSTHHQMMYPFSVRQYELLAWTNELSTTYETGGAINLKPRVKNGKVVEPEVVFYPETQSLAVQYHPERLNYDSRGYSFFIEQIKRKLL